MLKKDKVLELVESLKEPIKIALTVLVGLGLLHRILRICLAAWAVYVIFYTGGVDLVGEVACSDAAAPVSGTEKICNFFIWMLDTEHRFVVALMMFYMLKG